MRVVLALTAVLAVMPMAACAQPNPAANAASAPAAPAAQSGVSFLAQNALADGVVTTASGLQYKVIRSGPATGAHPGANDTATVNYEGKLLSGEVFDSSYTRNKPATFEVGGVIPGWTEALELMRPGDEWMLYIPPKLAYGFEQKGPIPPGSVLIFKVELISTGAQPD